MLVSYIVLCVVLAIAVWTDVTTGKIKNWLTFPAIAVGPIVALLVGGKSMALASLAGIGVMVLVSVVVVVFGLFGGGDIKLLIAVGSLGGLPLVKDSLLFTALAGGVLAILWLLLRRQAADASKQAAQAMWMKLIWRVDVTGGKGSGVKLPYSIAIAAGTAAALFWRPW